MQQLHRLVDQEVRAHFKEQVLKTAIPVEPKIAESAFLGRPVVLHSPNSSGARAYIRACAECLAWVEETQRDANAYQEQIINGLKHWLHDETISATNEPVHLSDDSLPPQSVAQTASATETPNEFRVTIRNGVILALALTAGMALAFLGM